MAKGEKDMEAAYAQFLARQPIGVLCAGIAAFLFLLGKGADIMVEQAVFISDRWGVPRLVIGATLVSAGTTFPEAAVSVAAAVKGNPGIALGNAVGSIICDTGLVLGCAALLSPMPLSRASADRQERIQFAAGALLVLACIPWAHPFSAFSRGGSLSRPMGFIFLLLLAFYLFRSIRGAGGISRDSALEKERGDNPPIGRATAKLFGGAALVVAASRLLIPAVAEAALRMNVPESIVGATLVAFGTSLPELVTAVTAVRKGFGELAVGNVIGANILNVLFVSGAAAAVTNGGLEAPAQFFRLLFPAMIGILVICRIGAFLSGDRLGRPSGALLVGIYAAVTWLGFRTPWH